MPIMLLCCVDVYYNPLNMSNCQKFFRMICENYYLYLRLLSAWTLVPLSVVTWFLHGHLIKMNISWILPHFMLQCSPLEWYTILRWELNQIFLRIKSSQTQLIGLYLRINLHHLISKPGVLDVCRYFAFLL